MADPEAALADYLNRAGERGVKTYEGGRWLVTPNGFCQWRVQGDTLHIIDLYGPVNHWLGVLKGIARKFKCRRAIMTTRRCPEAWAKRAGFRLTAYVMERGWDE